jgi:hypothetical protein
VGRGEGPPSRPASVDQSQAHLDAAKAPDVPRLKRTGRELSIIKDILAISGLRIYVLTRE